MNRDRRKRLAAIIKQAWQLQEQLTAIQEEEQNALDNMPENLQLTDRYADMENAAEALEDATDGLFDIISGLEEIL